MIPFTQFLLPDGEPRLVTVDRPQRVEKKAKVLIDAGYVFEIEMLRTGEVSMDCSQGETVLHHEIVKKNGPEVLTAVDRLVETSHAIYERIA